MKWPWQKKEPESIPYWLRNAAEDAMVPNVRILLEIQQFLVILENELEVQRKLLGEIRNGQYRKDQPAAERNGRVREPFADGR